MTVEQNVDRARCLVMSSFWPATYIQDEDRADRPDSVRRNEKKISELCPHHKAWLGGLWKESTWTNGAWIPWTSITHYGAASAAQSVHSTFLFSASFGGHTTPSHPAGFSEWHCPGSPAGWSGEWLLPWVLEWKEALTWNRKLNTWPTHTHNSCTGTLQYSLAVTSILTNGKTVIPQCISRRQQTLAQAWCTPHIIWPSRSLTPVGTHGCWSRWWKMTLSLWFFLKLFSQLMKGRVQSMCRLPLINSLS